MILMNIYLTYFGLVLLSLILKRHYKEIISQDINKALKFLFASLGSVFLIFTLFMFIKNIGLSLGISYWVGYLSLSILFISMIYTYIPKMLIKLSIALFILTLILTIL